MKTRPEPAHNLYYSQEQIEQLKIVQHLVQQRQRSLIHIGNTMSPDGCMWMNLIKIKKPDIEQHIMSSVVPVIDHGYDV